MRQKLQLIICFLVILVGVEAQTFQKDTLPKVKKPSILFAPIDAKGISQRYLPNFIPRSPQAASIEQYGDYQVNLATGIADISIPLYTAQSGGLAVPITLRYHHGGFKMTDRASWTGLGWTLDVGGMVSRSIQGKKDYPSNYLLNQTVASRNPCYNAADFNFCKDYFINGGLIDAEPDVFSYSSPKRGGKFFLGQAGAASFLIPFAPVQIPMPTFSSNDEPISFDLIDNDGVKYVFGMQNDGTNVYESASISDGTYVPKGYRTGWPLTKVLSPNSDDAIALSYQDGGFVSVNEKQWTASIIHDVSGNYYTATGGSVYADATTISSTMYQKNIEKISFENGEIEFIQSTAGQRQDATDSYFLSRINVYNFENGAKVLIRKILFDYGYFTDRQGQNFRLKLNGITTSDASGTINKSHQFNYWTNSFSWKDDVTVDYSKRDYWGYYNGANNTSLITVASYTNVSPTCTIINGGANRDAVDTYLKEGLLKEIVYPTKGKTEFDYEANRFKNAPATYMAGGNRIKTIKNFGSSNSLKRFEYGSDDGVGIGKLPIGQNPQTETYSFVQKLNYFNNSGNATISGTANLASITQNGVSELYGFDGSPVFYTDVKEYEDASGAANGYSQYEFSFSKDFSQTLPYFRKRELRPWLRGQLKSKKVFDNAGSLIAENSNTYEERNIQSKVLASFVYEAELFEGSFTISCPLPGLSSGMKRTNQYAYSSYPYYTGASVLTASTSTIDGISKTVNYGYDANLMPTSEESFDSETSTVLTENIVYPNHSTYSTNTVAQSLVVANMLAVPLEVKMDYTTIDGSSTIYQEKKVFGSFAGNNARGLVNNLLAKEVWVAPTGASLEKRVDFTQYDSYGNATEYVVDEKSNSLLWGYNRSLLLAEINNANNTTVANAIASSGLNVNSLSISNLSASQRNTVTAFKNSLSGGLAKWFVHRPLIGLSELYNTNDIGLGFEYDGLQRLYNSKDHNGKLTDLYLYNYATTAPSSCTTPAAPSISVSSTSLCNAVLSATGCAGVINWSNGQSGNAIVLSTANSTTITATCSVGTCTSTASNSLVLPILPTGWQAIDIGSNSLNGCTQYDSGILTMKSDGGNNSIGGSNPDNFHFVYKAFTGDVSVITKLTGMTLGDGFRSGIMIRNSLDPKSVMFSIIQDNNEFVGKLLRNTDNDVSHLWQFNIASLNSTWIRLDKVGNSVTARFSTLANPNPAVSTDWQEMGNNTSNPPPSMTWNGTFYLGFATMAYPAGSNQTTFTNVSVNGVGL
jgi:hypothetical protein